MRADGVAHTDGDWHCNCNCNGNGNGNGNTHSYSYADCDDSTYCKTYSHTKASPNGAVQTVIVFVKANIVATGDE